MAQKKALRKQAAARKKQKREAIAKATSAKIDQLRRQIAHLPKEQKAVQAERLKIVIGNIRDRATAEKQGISDAISKETNSKINEITKKTNSAVKANNEDYRAATKKLK